MIEAVRAYLALLATPPEGEAARLEALAEALDRLAFAYHSAPEAFVDDASDPPDRTHEDYKDMRKVAIRTFPKFGFYAVVPPEENTELETLMGDAIDDVADIALEMAEVAWRWDNNGSQDAAYHFQFGFRSHWGRHLQDLRSYVHAQLFSN